MERTPVTAHLPQYSENVRCGKMDVYKKLRKDPIKRFYSTDNHETLKDAILILVMSGSGYSIKLDTIFDPEAKSEQESTLEITQSGYGIAFFGPVDKWHLIRNGREIFSADNPHDVVDRFFEIVEEYKLGNEYASI